MDAQLAKTATERAIFAQLDTVNSELQNAWNALARFESAYCRLMNPTPQPVEKNAAQTPIAQTVEARLNDIAKTAAGLAALMHSVADKFDKAI